METNEEKLKVGDNVIIEHSRTPRVPIGTKAVILEIKKLGSVYGFDDSDRFEIKIKHKKGVGYYYPSDLKKTMTNTQKLERLKEIEETINKWKIRLRNSQDGSNREIQCNCRILDLKQEANKIGEELIGCGKELGEYPTLKKYDIKPFCGEIMTNWNARDNPEEESTYKRLCPTCQEAKEILARINNG